MTTWIGPAPGTTWTCRDKHLATSSHCTAEDGLPTNAVVNLEEQAPTTIITKMARPTSFSFPRPRYNTQALAELRETFNHVSRGRKYNDLEAITLDDYFGFFNVTDDRKGSYYGKGIEEKFHAHDINGDGLLSFEEVQLLCGEAGCA